MKKLTLLLLFIYQVNILLSQTSATTCITATPICSNTVNTFPSSTNVGAAESGPSYSCLGSQPNPAWFYFKIQDPGSISINISQMSLGGTGTDVDFICWGPFTSATAPCSGQLTAGNVVDCSYSTSFNEIADVSNALTGQYYILMITNYSNVASNVTFSVSGTGTISCTESCVTHPFYNSPLCVNGTLQLVSTNHFGLGNYSWSGPNGFSSTIQNPTISNVNGTNSGYYHLNYTRDSTCNYTDSVWVNVDTCGTLTGRVFADVNTNCTFDSIENPIANVQVKLSQGGTFIGYAWSDAFGYYYFDVPPGNYTIEVLPSPTYPITCSGSLAHNVTVSALTILTEDFAVDCHAVNLATSGVVATGLAFFPGLTHYMFPTVASLGPDCGSTPIPGQLVVILDPLVQYAGAFSSYPTPNIVIPTATGDTLKWDIADISSLAYYGYYNYPFSYTTSSSATIGDTVHIKSIIYPITGDVDTTNNTYVRDFVVGNSYDPNSKEVLPTGYGQSGFIPASTSKLEYTVNFQNTGTASAQNIYVLDTLDTDLDINTLKIIGSSHIETTTLLPGNVLKFNFSNIMLPDSLHNEPLSHGYVKYTISPKSDIAPGDQITNRAFIYFDFNSPIITNTVTNTVEFPLSIKENSDYLLKVFPNPTTNTVVISFEDKQSKMLSFKILNLEGQVVYAGEGIITNGKFVKTIDLSAISQGVYLLEINSDKQIVHQKIIKN
jgi:hypothetical protein